MKQAAANQLAYNLATWIDDMSATGKRHFVRLSTREKIFNFEQVIEALSERDLLVTNND